ncbi:MAG: 2-oxoacid:acceptor oxidoreductase subunit alpha [Candidatus Eisenbacteria bacterium]|nr:2-oxoacid:acceptor oxidoreductase subunit alpha [Candidatus Eisenbacteria bacterium]
MMTADPKGVLTGEHYLDGDHAAAEGALAAGCRFFAGYPITPSTEVAERIAARFPRVGGVFVQMEDELGSMAAILGGAWAGAKSMTVTSGPGFSLMMENLGLGVMMEVPTVLVNVQRGGPSTGLPTLPGQADIMQARWGSHGDYEIIAVSPSSPQEAFDHTIMAFNFAEKYRVPTMVMMDECVGHMTEKVVIPEAEEIEIVPRKMYDGPKTEYLPYEPDEDMVPWMVRAGDGYRFHTTGLTHDEKGYPVMNSKCQEKCVHRLVDKIRSRIDEIVVLEEDGVEGADVVVVSYGITSRVTVPAVERARKDGINVGSLRLVTIWPFPENRIRELSRKIKTFIVPEINYGQLCYEVERCAAGNAETVLVPHGGGWVHDPGDIYDAIKKGAK